MTQAQITNREPTMEEILASIRRIIEDNNAPAPMDADGTLADMSASDVSDFEREFAEADVFSKPVQDTIAALESSNAYARSRIDPLLDLDDADEIEVQGIAPPVMHLDERPAAFHELRPIISEEAGRQVAKSFEHLSVALHEERNTSVAQLTEEMVRPMLQDWLDNNLPTLVERLVREEIERVSRGTR